MVRSLFTWTGAYCYGKVDGVNFGYQAMTMFPYSVQVSLFKRSAYGFAAMMATFLSVTLMPVSIAVAIMQTTAFVTAIMAYFIADESLSW